MQYKISCLYQGKERCEQVIDVPHAGAATVHYESLLVRQPSHPQCADFTDWQMERVPVEGALIEKGETECEKKIREMKEKLASGQALA